MEGIANGETGRSGGQGGKKTVRMGEQEDREQYGTWRRNRRQRIGSRAQGVEVETGKQEQGAERTGKG